MSLVFLTLSLVPRLERVIFACHPAQFTNCVHPSWSRTISLNAFLWISTTFDGPYGNVRGQDINVNDLDKDEPKQVQASRRIITHPMNLFFANLINKLCFLGYSCLKGELVSLISAFRTTIMTTKVTSNEADSPAQHGSDAVN